MHMMAESRKIVVTDRDLAFRLMSKKIGLTDRKVFDAAYGAELKVLEPRLDIKPIAIQGVESSGLTGASADDRRKVFDSFLEAATVDRRKAIMETMKLLFPRRASAYGGSNYQGEWLSIWRKKLGICSPDVCDRYFLLSLPPGDLSSIERNASS